MKMVVKRYEIKFGDLRISRDKIAKILKFGEGQIPHHFIDMIEHELRMASTLARISGGYLVSESIMVDKAKQLITLGEVDFNVGKNISVFLQKAEKLALLLCTAGPGLEKRSHQLMREGHYPEGFIMDTIGSVAVETAMDIIHSNLAQDMKIMGLNVSNRYSPGYCSWDVSEQQKLFSFFPEKFAGITLSDSSLMNPIKSVSGIAGIGTGIKYLGYACDGCTMADCVFRDLKD
jgi:hypothetical protein